MDYYSFNPDIADTLVFKNSTIRRQINRLGHKTPDRECFEHFAQDNVRFANISSNKDRYPAYPKFYSDSQQEETSTSLILKKTTQVEVVEQYSEESYESISIPRRQKNLPTQHHTNSNRRPVVKVTIIPLNTTKVKPRKRRNKRNKPHKTLSNQENCLRAQNIYLVIPGKKKEYELKTTESDYSNSVYRNYFKNEKFLVEHNLQSLLQSLDMDKKKKKAKKDKGKKEDDDDDFPSKASLLNVLEASGSPKLSLLKECMCTPSSHPEEHVAGRKSRVRITGKIGLTEDDRYVLKCNATIDGKPVETSISYDKLHDKWAKQKELTHMDGALKHHEGGFNHHHKSPPGSPIERNWEPSMKKCPAPGAPCERKREHIINLSQGHGEKKKERNLFQKEAYTQATMTIEQHFEKFDRIPCPAFHPGPVLRSSVETQCDQSLLNSVCFSNIEKLQIVSANRDEMIQCNCINDGVSNLGIIGDYTMNETVANKSCSSPLVIISVYPKHVASTEKIFEDNSSAKESPMRLNKKESGKKGGGGKKKEGANKEGKGARSRSPTPSKTGKGKAEKDQKGKNVKGNKGGKKGKGPKGMKEKSLSPSLSPDRQSLRSGLQSPLRGDAGIGTCTECCKGCTGRSDWDMPSQLQQTYDEPKNPTKRMMNWVSAKKDVSNVAISIDGEKEFYDVLFRHGDITTDLRVQKTFKDEVEGTVDERTDSLENFFMPEGHKHRKRSFSQTFLFDNHPNAETDLQKQHMMSTLHVRDSIEISHRKEEKDSSHSSMNTASESSSSSTSENKIKFAPAPVKHYQGDNCKLPNPVQRDKEIRELLGIDKRSSRTSQEFPMAAPESDLVQFLIWNKTSRNVTTNTSKTLELQPKLNYIKKESSRSFWQKPRLSREINSIDLSDCVAYTYSSSHEGTSDTTENDHFNVKDVFITNKAPGKNVVSIATQTKVFQYPFGQYFNPPVIVNKECQTDVERITKQKSEYTFEEEYKNPVNKTQTHNSLDRENYLKECNFTHFEKDCIFCNIADSICSRDSIHHSTINYIKDQLNSLSKSNVSRWPYYQQLILNRNINVYVQVEEKKNKKPIVLTYKQFAKVKRAIDKIVSKKSLICKRSNISNGEIVLKAKKKTNFFVTTGVQCETRIKKVEKIIQTQNSPSKNNKEIKRGEDKALQSYPFECYKELKRKDEKNTIKKNYENVYDGTKNVLKIGGEDVMVAQNECYDCDKHLKKEEDVSSVQIKTYEYMVDRLLKEEEKERNIKQVQTKTNEYYKRSHCPCEKDRRLKRDEDKKTMNQSQNYQYDNCKRFTKEDKNNGRNNIRKRNYYQHNYESQCGLIEEEHKAKEKIKLLGANVICLYNREESRRAVHLPEKSRKSSIKQGLKYRDSVTRCRKCGRMRGLQEKMCKFCHGIETTSTPDVSDNTVRISRRATSSTEIQCKKVSHQRKKLSSTATVDVVQDLSVAEMLVNNYDRSSLHTIYKGVKKSGTPNLGTSEFSLYSAYTDATGESRVDLRDTGPRKPFLKRLLSYLVMRSKISEVKPLAKELEPTISSADAYHINSSLEGVELTSSLYDTSASFYSKHSIHPVNSKMKRGFLSSVRGFLTNRRNL